MDTNAKQNRFEKRKEFPLGGTYITPGAQQVLSNDECMSALARHARGDWGDVGDEDWRENDLSVEQGFRILSSYSTASGVKFWIITEADRSATTVLLPEEY